MAMRADDPRRCAGSGATVEIGTARCPTCNRCVSVKPQLHDGASNVATVPTHLPPSP